MKLKLTLMAVAATLALGFQAQAQIGTTVSHSKLNVSLVVTTNKYDGSYITNNSSYFYKTAKAKITNKLILDLMANWTNADRTVEPWKSAQLVLGYDWDNHILVVDKTGTNVLFDCDAADDH